MDDGDDRRRRLEALFDGHGKPLLEYALRRAHTPADAADVVSETMLVAWRRIDEVPLGHDARLWLIGVARFVLANHHRSHRRRIRLGERLRDSFDNLTIEPVAISPLADEVEDALRRLSADDREVIRLATWEQLTSAEIAAVLDISPGAARNRLHRARQRLLSVLGDHEDARDRLRPAADGGWT